jgi:UPF0755 protein
MPDDFDKLNEIFGVKSDKQADGLGGEVTKPVDKKSPLERLDEAIYDPDKHKPKAEAGPEERDYRPIRRRRDGKIGCLGGLMYFVFVVSVSVIIACVGWMAATDVLALNKGELTAEVTLPQSAFTEKEIKTDDNGTETVTVADIDYVARTLKDAGIIEYKFLFKLFCSVSNAETKIDPGTYELSTDFDYRALVKKMQTGSGAMLTTTITFPEGYTMEQIFAKLEEEGVCSKDDLYSAAADYVYNYAFLDDAGTGDAARLEGFLFPDTYEFYQGMQASGAINKFLENFHSKVTADMYKQAENLGISLKQAVVVASMIEGEAANDEERATIASVIYNRLAAGMPLQIDATVQYALGEHKEVLTDEDLAVDSPYNTYLHTGLPPGAICSPGLASIKAALQPADTEYYYYALDTETGTHKFFKTFDEQQAFVAEQGYAS